MLFKDLSIGDAFYFACEKDPRFIGSGISRGPWIKTSTKNYRPIDSTEFAHVVSTVVVPVYPTQYTCSYEGWTNQETWELCLFVDNNYDVYKLIYQNGPYTPQSAQAICERIFMTRQAMSGVCWFEVADHFNAKIAELHANK